MQTYSLVLARIPIKGVADIAMQYLCSRGGDLFKKACKYGYHEQCILMLESRNAALAIEISCKYDHVEIVRSILEQFPMNRDYVLRMAGTFGRAEIARLAIERGANDWNVGLLSAAACGHVEVVRMMLEGGADNLCDALSNAASRGHLGIVRLLLEYGANNFRNASWLAHDNGNTRVVQLIEEAEKAYYEPHKRLVLESLMQLQNQSYNLRLKF